MVSLDYIFLPMKFQKFPQSKVSYSHLLCLSNHPIPREIQFIMIQRKASNPQILEAATRVVGHFS